MIDAGEIFACIDSEKSMVRFLGDPEQYASPAMVQRLDAAIQQSTALAERFSAVAHAVRSPRRPSGSAVIGLVVIAFTSHASVSTYYNSL